MEFPFFAKRRAEAWGGNSFLLTPYDTGIACQGQSWEEVRAEMGQTI